MNILIVDDSNEKIANVLSVIRGISEEFNVESVNDVVGAQKMLIDNKYDLLISDLLLPIRYGDPPVEDGGYRLVKEVERSLRIQAPNYIVGLTQYEECKNMFPNIWNVLLYAQDSSKWQDAFKDIIRHILRVQPKNSINAGIKKPTIFFEGKTDELIFREALMLFRPEIIDKLTLRSEKSAGASWVVRQIIVWSYSLPKNKDGYYIRSIGLLDGDDAGIRAKSDIGRIISPSSVESKIFKIYKLSPDYAVNLIPLYSKGLNIPVTLEEMFPEIYWKYSYDMGWLEKRKNPDLLLRDPTGWDKYSQSLGDHINGLSLSPEEKIYLYKFRKEAKEDFCRYILSLELEEKKKAMRNFNKLVNDIINYLLLSED